MIVVVMEKSCRNPRDWTGAVGGKLGGLLYVDLSDDAKFDGGINHLTNEIRNVVADERVATASGGAGGSGEASSSTPHDAPRRSLSSGVGGQAHDEAVSLGLITLLEQAGVEASDEQLAAGAQYVKAEGAASVQELVEYDNAEGLVSVLALKKIPQAKLRSTLQTMAARQTKPSAAGCCVVS